MGGFGVGRGELLALDGLAECDWGVGVVGLRRFRAR